MKSIKNLPYNYEINWLTGFVKVDIHFDCNRSGKYFEIHYTAQDGNPYIWCRRTTWALD